MMNKRLDWGKVFDWCHLLIVVIVIVGALLFVVYLMLNLADNYHAIDDPCKACEEMTIKVCTPDYSYNNLYCINGNCIELNLSSGGE